MADPTSDAQLLPAAHLPAAVQAASNQANPGMLAMLKQMQSQINALMGNAEVQNLGDVVIVNPAGRITEISGKQSIEILAKPGFRKATEEEEVRYRKAILRQTPEYLRRVEKKRLIEEKRLLDEIENEDDSDTITVEELLQAPVTDAQKTGALTPEQVAQQTQSQIQTQPTTATSTGDGTSTDTGSDNETTTPKPPSRRAKSSASKTNTSANTSTATSTGDGTDEN